MPNFTKKSKIYRYIYIKKTVVSYRSKHLLKIWQAMLRRGLCQFGHTDLHDVDDQGEDVADEEDEHDDHEHGGQADLPLLQPGQLGALRVGFADLGIET